MADVNLVNTLDGLVKENSKYVTELTSAVQIVYNRAVEVGLVEKGQQFDVLDAFDEIERLRDGYQEIAAIEGLCVKPWTGVKCEGCECGDKNNG